MKQCLLLLICLSFVTLSVKSHDLWQNPFIIGASVSDGFQHTEKLGGPLSDALAIDHYLKKIVTIPNGKISNLSNRFCFIYPIGISHRQVRQATSSKPSVIFAIDQLFWHLYGNFSSSEQRLITFKNALKKLDPITCPLVIGNIPDAKHSIGKMLSSKQVPKIETINKANKILNKWVKKRKLTAILDLATFMSCSVADKEIKLNNITYKAGTTKQFLQTDLLHPSALGAQALSCAAIESLQTISNLKKDELKFPNTHLKKN